MEKIPYRAIGRDLFAEIKCGCPDPRYAGGPLQDIMTSKVSLSGYADNYFFDEVNKEPREVQCTCGKKWNIQWFRDGIEVNQVETNE